MGCFNIFHIQTFSFPLLPPIIPGDCLEDTASCSGLDFHLQKISCYSEKSAIGQQGVMKINRCGDRAPSRNQERSIPGPDVFHISPGGWH